MPVTAVTVALAYYVGIAGVLKAFGDDHPALVGSSVWPQAHQRLSTQATAV